MIIHYTSYIYIYIYVVYSISYYVILCCIMSYDAYDCRDAAAAGAFGAVGDGAVEEPRRYAQSTKSFPAKSPRVELSGRPPMIFYGRENSHPLELRVCLSQTLGSPNSE